MCHVSIITLHNKGDYGVENGEVFLALNTLLKSLSWITFKDKHLKLIEAFDSFSEPS